MKQIFFGLLLLLFSTQILRAKQISLSTPPKDLQDGWAVNRLSAKATDTSRFHNFFEQLATVDHQLHSMLLIKNNELILDAYFDNYDESTLHDLRSVNKSIKALLVGIALKEGFIQSIDDPISLYLKEPVPRRSLDPRKDEITLRHLLTMSAGWDCNDWNKKSKGQEDRVYKKKDWLQYTLDLPMINDPGDTSTYCSMGVLLLAEIIAQASGLTIDQFAETYLFEPLGIKHAKWSHTNKAPVIASGRRLYLTPRDLSKIGLLVLRGGDWNGKQVVPSQWIKEMISVHTSITGIDYGYLWWSIPFNQDGRQLMSHTATGNGGQYIFVLPEKDMVVVFTGGAYNSSDDKLAFAIMRDVVLPSFTE